jgi:hypothetical protein
VANSGHVLHGRELENEVGRLHGDWVDQNIPGVNVVRQKILVIGGEAEADEGVGRTFLEMGLKRVGWELLYRDVRTGRPNRCEETKQSNRR